MRHKLILVCFAVVALALPTAAIAASKTDTDTAFGITQYQWLYYNTQSCGGATRYQITDWEHRWYRIDTNRTVRYQGVVGGQGYDCLGHYQNWSAGPKPPNWFTPCWGPCGNSSSPNWSRTQVYAFTGKPYLSAQTDQDDSGSWLDGRMQDLSGHEWGRACQELTLFGSILGC